MEKSQQLLNLFESRKLTDRQRQALEKLFQSFLNGKLWVTAAEIDFDQDVLEALSKKGLVKKRLHERPNTYQYAITEFSQLIVDKDVTVEQARVIGEFKKLRSNKIIEFVKQAGPDGTYAMRWTDQTGRARSTILKGESRDSWQEALLSELKAGKELDKSGKAPPPLRKAWEDALSKFR